MSKKNTSKKIYVELSETPTGTPSEPRKKAIAADNKKKADEKRFEEATKKSIEKKGQK